MQEKSELLMTLELVEALRLGGPRSTRDLCHCFGVSVATLKRRIDDARHLGAAVESVKSGHAWVYHLGNGPAVAARLARWLQLEQSRSLV